MDYDYALDRPYDRGMNKVVRDLVRKNRVRPTGVEHKLGTRTMYPGSPSSREVVTYPLRDLKVGDFFYVPVGDKNLNNLRTYFKQAERRMDVELTIRKTILENEIYLLIWLSHGGPISAFKSAAGLPVPKSQGGKK